MTCEFLAGDGVMFSTWGEPSMHDVDNGMLCLRMVYEKTGGPIVYITRVPVVAPAPDPKVRQYLNSKMHLVTTMCESYHVVLEGVGFVAAMKRGVLLSIFQISHRRNTFFVHSNVDDVEQKVLPARRSAVRAVLRQAFAQGLLSENAPASRVA
jgi:hypothetical protein